jgi:hypothetical protein
MHGATTTKISSEYFHYKIFIHEKCGLATDICSTDVI